MITIIQGRPGMGKTLFGVDTILAELPRRKVFTNIQIKLKPNSKYQKNYQYITNLEEIIHEKNGLIVLDECQHYLNSRKWDKLPDEFQLMLQQHRHQQLDIIGFTQSVKRADVIFRELAQRFFDMRKVFTIKLFNKAIGLFIIREYDPDSMESPSRQYDPIGWPKVFLADPILFDTYDTYQNFQELTLSGNREIIEYLLTPITKSSIEKKIISRKVIPTISTNEIVEV